MKKIMAKAWKTAAQSKKKKDNDSPVIPASKYKKKKCAEIEEAYNNQWEKWWK